MPAPKVSKAKSSSGGGAPSKQLRSLAPAKKSKKPKVEPVADDASDGELAAATGGEEAGSKGVVVHGR